MMLLSFLRALLITDPLIILSTVVMGSISVLTSLFDKGGGAADRIAGLWARLLLRISGVKVRVQGLDRIEENQSCVFVGNHLSFIDTPVVLASIPVRFLFLVHARYVRLPFLGTHLRRCGHFSVDPDNVRASIRTMTEAARAVQQRGHSVLVFPEGSRAAGDMKAFKDGAAYIAIKAGVPVIPFALSGTREVLPVGSIHVRGRSVDMIFGEPVPTAGYALRDSARLTLLLRDKVAALLAGARKEQVVGSPAPD